MYLCLSHANQNDHVWSTPFTVFHVHFGMKAYLYNKKVKWLKYDILTIPSMYLLFYTYYSTLNNIRAFFMVLHSSV